MLIGKNFKDEYDIELRIDWWWYRFYYTENDKPRR